MGGRDYASRLASLAGRRSLTKLKRECSLASILAGNTCSPISMQDFELYLAYRELSLENLQFVVWYLDYQDRFFKLPLELQQQSPDPAVIVPQYVPTTPGALSSYSPPSYTYPTTVAPPRGGYMTSWRMRFFSSHTRSSDDVSQSVSVTTNAEPDEYPFSPPTAASSSYPPLSSASSNFGLTSKGSGMTPLLLSPMSPGTDSGSKRNYYPSSSAANARIKHPPRAATRNDRLPPSPRPPVPPSQQPFRDETLRVVATFMRPGGTAKKELALEEDVREEVYRNLALTTHPNVFRRVYKQIYLQLEMSSRNFLTVQTSNTNLPKQLYWYSLGLMFFLLSMSLAALTIMTFPTHSRHPPHRNRPMARAVRLVAVPFAMFSACMVYSAWRGFCSQVYGRGGTQLKAWELEDPGEVGVKLRRKRKRSGSKVPQSRAGEGEVDVSLDVAGKASDEDVKDPDLLGEEEVTQERRRDYRTPSDRTVIAPFAFTHSNSIDNQGSSGVGDIETGDMYSNDTHDNQRHQNTQPLTAGIPRASFNGSNKQRPPNVTESEDPSTHEIVFVRPKRRAMADLAFMRPPVFGPEKVVLDARVRKYHEAILNDMAKAAIWYTLCFTIVVLALPGPPPR